MTTFNVLVFLLLQQISTLFVKVFFDLNRFTNNCFPMLKTPCSFINDEINEINEINFHA